MKKLFFLLPFLLILSLSSLGWGATYYVRNDSTVTCANKANATDPSAAATSLGVTGANGVNSCTTFAAGDIIYYSAQGGDYTAVESLGAPAMNCAIFIPQSGTSSADITYEGLPDGVAAAYPLIDVSANAANANGLRINAKDYVTVNHFRIKGSGGG